jgi:beta-galactosidase
LTADRSELSADGQDLAYVVVEAVDDEGRLNLNAGQQVHFTLSGPGVIAGLGNGDGQSSGSYQGETLALFHGRGLVVVRSSRTAGPIQLSATAVGLTNASTSVTSRQGSIGPELQ